MPLGETEYVVQTMDTDGQGKELGWYTGMTYATEAEARLYHTGLRHGLDSEAHRLGDTPTSPVRTRVCKVVYEVLEPQG